MAVSKCNDIFGRRAWLGNFAAGEFREEESDRTPMRWDSVKDMNCSVARTLSVIGERWTMLILREAFLGRHRFDEFQNATGIARNILSSRLRDLVRDGIFDRARSEGDSGRVEYRLTRKGLELYPVLIAMMRWSTPG